MRISDWSSDVCSSDLLAAAAVEIGDLETRNLQGLALDAAEPVLDAQRGVCHRPGKDVVGAHIEDRDHKNKDDDTKQGFQQIHPFWNKYQRCRAASRPVRAEERRGGKEGANQCKYRGAQVT